jgi:MSHA biogenesis protein MshQ
VEVVSGRVKLSNAYGSELLPLTLTATAQYYMSASAGWVTSTTDSATQFSTRLSTAVPPGNVQAVIVKGPLALGDISVAGAGAVTFASGTRSFVLAAPGANRSGSVDLSLVTAPAFLLPGTTGRATFGVYKGNSDFIYQREAY